MEAEIHAAFRDKLYRGLENTDGALLDILPLLEESSYELRFGHFGHFDGPLFDNVQHLARRWGQATLLEVDGREMRWRLDVKSPRKCHPNWYNSLGVALSYASLVWLNPLRWWPS
jgi:hypothetical protein